MSSAPVPSFQLDPRWYDAVTTRASRRSYDGRPLLPDAAKSIDSACRRVSASSEAGVRAVYVDSPPDGVFTGLIGGYGRAITGSPAFVAFTGREDRHFVLGYLGQAVILEAAALGVDTCWIAGSFSADAAAAYVELVSGERVLAVTPVGYGTSRVPGGERLLNAVVRPRARLELERIARGAESWPAWAHQAAESARLAPSGQNRQPWRLHMDDTGLVLGCTTERPYWTAQIDCGTAALHLELGALHAGVSGSWEPCARPDIARFVPHEFVGSERTRSASADR